MRTKALAVALVGVFMLVTSAQRAEAIPIGTTNPAAISGPTVISINFEDLVGTEEPAITDQYADLGLLISGLYGKTSALPAGFGLVSGTNGDDYCCPDVTFKFLEAGRSFGFYIFTNGPAEATFEISTFYGGVQTFSAPITFATGGEPKFVGIVEQDSTQYFDQVVVSAISEANAPPVGYVIDNLKMQVPEPGSLPLLALGTLALLFCALTVRPRRV